MLALLMGMTDVSESSPIVTPQFTAGPTVGTGFAGACNTSTHTVAFRATVRVSWTLSAPYGALYQAKIYENGIFVTNWGATSWDKNVDGLVEGSNRTFTSDWTYRVDIVRISDNAVVASATTAAWVQDYGTCGLAV